MSRFDWKDLTLTSTQLRRSAPDHLEFAAEAVTSKAITLAHGISAVGNLLACTSSNGDTGLSEEAATSLGWMLESLGELTAVLINTGDGLNEELARRAAALSTTTQGD